MGSITRTIANNLTTDLGGAGGINFKNLIINGDMSIAQRSTSVSSITSTGYYTVDRWNFVDVNIGTFTMSQDTDVPSGQGFAKSLKIDCTTADASPASSDRLDIQQRFEGQNLQYLKKGTSSAESLTLSFWVKSNKTGTYIVELFDNDNARQISKSYTINSSNTWEKKTLTFAGDTSGALANDNGNSFQVSWWLGAGSDYTSGALSTTWTSNTNANRAVGQVNLADDTANEWYITGVQLEAGTSASDFEFLPYDVNLARCQRYYEKSYAQGTTPGTVVVAGRNTHFFSNTGSGYVGGISKFVVTKRAGPTITIYAPGNGATGNADFYNFGSSTTQASITLGSSNNVSFEVYRTGTSCNAMAYHYQAAAEL